MQRETSLFVLCFLLGIQAGAILFMVLGHSGACVTKADQGTLQRKVEHMRLVIELQDLEDQVERKLY